MSSTRSRRSNSRGRQRSRRKAVGIVPLLVAVVAVISQYRGGSTKVDKAPDTAVNISVRSTTKVLKTSSPPANTASATRPTEVESSSGAPEATVASAELVTHPDVGFRTRSKLTSHYQKHGAEFGKITLSQYLYEAQTLRDRPLSARVIQARQARGNWARFDRDSGAFIAFGDDLVILTFFRPDDGEEYFRRAVRATG